MNRFHVVRGAEGHEKLLSKKDEVKMSFGLFFFFLTLCKAQLGLPSCHPGLCGILSAWVGYCSSSSMVQTQGSSLPCVPIKFFFNVI